jgi:hypothetical protein
MTFVGLETVVKRSPLGLRFRDITRDVPVTDGLVVQAQPRGATRPQLLAVRSLLSGIYGFHTLPGLRDYEWGRRPASDWCTNGGSPAEANFVLTIADRQQRFLPQVLLLCLPREQVVEVPLYTSPVRPSPGGYAVIRGEIWDQSAGAPARWAMLSATPGGYATVADAKGLFALYIPYPPLADATGFGSVPLTQLAWPLTFAVQYAPGTQVAVLDGQPPTTASIVGQAAATVFDTETTSGSSLSRSVPYGRELVLSTARLPRLLVAPV